MPIKLRIIQTFDKANEEAFLELEKQFADLEKRRDDFPKGTRYRPVSSSLPVNTLIWESTFENIQKAYDALSFFSDDAEHEALAEKQSPFFRDVKVEFLDEL